MRNLKRQNHQLLEPSHYKKITPIDFVAAGVGCNCLITLHESGMLEKLLHDKSLLLQDIESYKNPVLIRSALVSLQACHIIEMQGSEIKITEFGIEVSKYMGLISIVFNGYADLMAHQDLIAHNRLKNVRKLIRGPAVSKAAVQLAYDFIDPVIMPIFESLQLSGTICDLGCGYGRMLSKVCKVSGNPGLGFDSEPHVIKQAKKHLKGTNVDVELGDICKLNGVWEDVVCLMQCHVFHDITPTEKCIKIMNSFLDNFPHLKYFVYIDTVTPSSNVPDILPGFDYVHGLQSIETRTYEETIEMFHHSKYDILKEIHISGLPNTFLWILLTRPKGHRKRS